MIISRRGLKVKVMGQANAVGLTSSRAVFCSISFAGPIVWNTAVSCHIVDLNHCRSPWTNQYDPPLEDGTLPSEKLRKLEIEANSAFDQFREM